MVSFLLSIVLITIVYGKNITSNCPLSCGTDTDDLLDVIDKMIDLGYSPIWGYLELYNEETSNTYIPFARSDTDYFVSQFIIDGSAQPYIRFGGQDAIIFRGCTPPDNIKYFGYRSYSSAQIRQQDSNTGEIEKFAVFEASLGDTINQNTISTENNDVYDSITNIITTGDDVTYTDIIDSYATSTNNLLLHPSINKDAINNGWFVNIHPDLGYFKYSTSDEDVPRDTLSIVMRIIWNDDDPNGCRSTYLNDTSSFPLLLFQKNELKPRSYVNEPLRPTWNKHQRCEKCSENEYYFNKAITTIIDNMSRKYNMEFISNIPFNSDIGKCSWLGGWFPPNNDANVYLFKHGFYCITFNKNCMFDNRDSFYSWTRTDYQLDDNDFYLIVGLNHNKFGMSSINSISTYYVQDPNDDGNPFKLIKTVNNNVFEEYDLRDIFECKKRRKLSEFYHHQSVLTHDQRKCEKLKNVFAVQVTRQQNCINELSQEMCFNNDILNDNQKFIFLAEAILNPVTNTMPKENCLIDWRLLKFRKKCTNIDNA